MPAQILTQYHNTRMTDLPHHYFLRSGMVGVAWMLVFARGGCTVCVYNHNYRNAEVAVKEKLTCVRFRIYLYT